MLLSPTGTLIKEDVVYSLEESNSKTKITKLSYRVYKKEDVV